MKKLLTLLMMSSILTIACKDDNKGLLDPTASIAIQGTSVTKSTDIDSVLHVITKSTDVQSLMRDGYTEQSHFWSKDLTDFLHVTRDTINRKLLFAGDFVVERDGAYLGSMIRDAKDVVFLAVLDSMGVLLDPKYNTDSDLLDALKNGGKHDTIGYIPNAVMKSAQERIIAAFEAEDFATCYELFDNAMTFIPTTSAEYRRLKAEGIE